MELFGLNSCKLFILFIRTRRVTFEHNTRLTVVRVYGVENSVLKSSWPLTGLKRSA